MNVKLILAAVGIMLLAGCATAEKGIGVAKAAIQTSSEFNVIFVEDVSQALIMAERTNDELAVQCWTYLKEFAEANAPDPDVPQGEVVGALSAYQKARNVRRTVIEVEITDRFRMECGPMLTDSAGALGRLGLSFALPVI